MFIKDCLMQEQQILLSYNESKLKKSITFPTVMIGIVGLYIAKIISLFRNKRLCLAPYGLLEISGPHK